MSKYMPNSLIESNRHSNSLCIFIWPDFGGGERNQKSPAILTFTMYFSPSLPLITIQKYFGQPKFA